MTVLTNDAPRRRSVVGKAAIFSAVFTAVVLFGKKAIAPHKATVANLVSMPLTVLGVACMDFAAFHLAHGWGWLFTGISLVLLDYVASDDKEQ